MFVVQRLEPHFPQASKTSIGHVVQLLYRASCFKVSTQTLPFNLWQIYGVSIRVRLIYIYFLCKWIWQLSHLPVIIFFLIFNKTKPTRTSRMYLMQIEDLKVFSWMTSPDQIDLDRAGKHQLLNKMRIIKIGWPSQKFRDKKHKKYTDEWKTTSIQTNFYIFFFLYKRLNPKSLQFLYCAVCS